MQAAPKMSMEFKMTLPKSFVHTPLPLRQLLTTK